MEDRNVLELRGINRRISSEFYIRNVNLTLQKGEVHAIVGRNASGKSTLFSVIMGLNPASSGEIFLNGHKVSIQTSEDAVKHGLILIGQNQQMFDNLSVYENIYFGHELTAFKGLPVLSQKKMMRAASDLFSEMGVQIDPNARMGSMKAAQKQLIAIARAIASDAQILLLDEPTTHLNTEEKKILLDAINRLKAHGKSFLIISHDLSEVLAIADRVSVISGGEIQHTEEISAYDRASLIEAIYGIKVEDLYRRDPVTLGSEVLRVETLSCDAFSDLNFSLRSGQIIAVMGNAASGAIELARALAGLIRTTGRIYMDGSPLEMASPITAVSAGIALSLTVEDEELIRDSEEMVNAGKQDTAANRMKVSAKRTVSSFGKVFGSWIGMRPKGEYVTGGNRQRELLERTMRKQAGVYILCEPSAGIDIPARAKIYYEISQLLQKGAGVLLVTADIEEALGLSDEIIVLSSGRLVLQGQSAKVSPDQVRRILQEEKEPFQ